MAGFLRSRDGGSSDIPFMAVARDREPVRGSRVLFNAATTADGRVVADAREVDVGDGAVERTVGCDFAAEMPPYPKLGEPAELVVRISREEIYMSQSDVAKKVDTTCQRKLTAIPTSRSGRSRCSRGRRLLSWRAIAAQL